MGNQTIDRDLQVSQNTCPQASALGADAAFCLAPTNRFDGEGCSALHRIVKRKSGKRVLFNFKSTGYLRDSLKQFKRYVLPISDSDAPSYNKGDGDEEADCDLIIDGVSRGFFSGPWRVGWTIY